MPETTPNPGINFAEWFQAFIQATHNVDPEESQTMPHNTGTDPKFIHDDDLDEFPLGFPRFARTQNLLHNGSIHRRFGALHQRSLQYDEVLLAQLEARLLELDKQDEVRNSPMLYSLSPAQTINGSGYMEEDCEKDKIIAKIQQVLARYSQALIYDAEIRKLHRIKTTGEFMAHLYSAKAYGILKGPAKEFLNAPHDFITTRSERLHDSLERLIFSGKRSWLMKLLSKKKPKGSIYAHHLHPLWFKAVSTAVVAFLVLFLLLLPVALLYFLEPGKAVSFTVVIIFSLTFTVALSVVPTVRLEVILMGLSAYAAVLVAFLANFQGGSCGVQDLA